MNTDLHLGYVGGSGGFLALHLLLLSDCYNCCIDGPINEVVDRQWHIPDAKLWKSKEVWPNNEKTTVEFINHRLFFHCNPELAEWQVQVNRKVLVYTDLKSQLALSKYKNAWVFHPDIDQQTQTLDYCFETFYSSIKDPAWPECKTISQASKLPSAIQQELQGHSDFHELVKATDWDEWFLSKHEHWKLNNQTVYSDCVPLAQCSDIVIDLKDIVKTHGAALLIPLNLPMTAQHRMLVDRWLALHSSEIIEQLTQP